MKNFVEFVQKRQLAVKDFSFMKIIMPPDFIGPKINEEMELESLEFVGYKNKN